MQDQAQDREKRQGREDRGEQTPDHATFGIDDCTLWLKAAAKFIETAEVAIVAVIEGCGEQAG